LFKNAQDYFVKATRPCVITYGYAESAGLCGICIPDSQVISLPALIFYRRPRGRDRNLDVYLVETLASVDVMVHHLVDLLDGGSRNALLDISNSIMLAEITAKRVRDQVDPPEWSPYPLLLSQRA